MCDKLKDINGGIFPHEHREIKYLHSTKKIIRVEMPEAPDESDWKEAESLFPDEKLIMRIVPYAKIVKFYEQNNK